jgi:hypothetical protein
VRSPPTKCLLRPSGRRLAAALAVLALAACGEARPKARRLPDGSRLIQKKEYQALYGPAGRLERVLHDSDGDGVAEAIVFYRVDGTPERSELDTDSDHVIDRWETLRPDGTVVVSPRACEARRIRGTAGVPSEAETNR